MSGASESASDLWLERSVFAGTMLGSVAFGVHLSVFSVAVYYMIIHPSHKPTNTTTSRFHRIPWAPFLLTFTFFALGVFQVAGNIKFFEKMWIDERNIEGGPIGWLTEHFSDPVNTFASVAYILANFLMDGMLLYRLFVIYDHNFLIVIIPALAFLASTVLSVFTVFQSARPGEGLWASTTIQFAVPYFSLSIGLNALMTLLIVLRLLYLRRRLSSVLSSLHAKTYTSVAAFFIESNAAYSIVGLIFIISYARNSNVQNLCLQTLDQVVCISPELIILRIYLGRAWSRETTAHISQHPLITNPTHSTFDNNNDTSTSTAKPKRKNRYHNPLISFLGGNKDDYDNTAKVVHSEGNDVALGSLKKKPSTSSGSSKSVHGVAETVNVNTNRDVTVETLDDRFELDAIAVLPSSQPPKKEVRIDVV